MFGLALLGGSGARQLLELLRSRAGERPPGRAVCRGGWGGRLCTAPGPAGAGEGEGSVGPGDGGTPIELPVTSSKSGKNSAWKRAVGAAGRPYSCRPVSPPSEPPSPRWRSRLPLHPPTPPAPEESLPATEGSVPHPAGSRRPPPRARPVGSRRARPQSVSGPWTGAGPPSGRGGSGSPRVLRPRPDGPREEWSSPVRPDLDLSPAYPHVTGLGSPAAAAVKPRARTVGTGRGLAPVGAHSSANTPARARTSWAGDASAAEGLF